MAARGFMYSTELLDDKSEVLDYNYENIPVKATITKQEEAPLLSIVNHWHNDLEFVYVADGEMCYSVDGVQCKLKKGQMIFVNSGRMHYGYWENEYKCEFQCTIFHPGMTEAKYAKKYMDAISGENTPSFMILHPEIIREKELIDLVCRLNKVMRQAKDGFELEMMSLIYGIIKQLGACITAAPEPMSYVDAKKLEAMHRMIGFVQQQYQQKISLNEIAMAGLVSRSACCQIFKKFLAKSPVEYLTEYRVSKSVELLMAGKNSMTDIALLCGFGSSSYFAETFHKVLGCTPTEYRAKCGK
ncbi:MAG: AraC family transcriptional regulator [Lachnospiraceae bacterium]|nr:AraC family transcriptional regulator [Lachnospiraceae bacterium]